MYRAYAKARGEIGAVGTDWLLLQGCLRAQTNTFRCCTLVLTSITHLSKEMFYWALPPALTMTAGPRSSSHRQPVINEPTPKKCIRFIFPHQPEDEKKNIYIRLVTIRIDRGVHGAGVRRKPKRCSVPAGTRATHRGSTRYEAKADASVA